MKKTIHYTLLAKSVPEFDKRDGKLYTCSLGYTPSMGVIRVYPLPLVGMKKWHTYEIQVEKNKRDSRSASWKLSSYTRHDNWVDFSKDCKLVGVANKTKVVQYLQSITTPSIDVLNKERRSIGLISCNAINPYWDSNSRFINTSQIGMFDDVEIASFTEYTKEKREKSARITFVDGDGKHDLQLNEWQYYEYQRKFGAKKDAFRWINPSDNNILLLGNMLQYQNNWMVLGVFKGAAINQSINTKLF